MWVRSQNEGFRIRVQVQGWFRVGFFRVQGRGFRVGVRLRVVFKGLGTW